MSGFSLERIIVSCQQAITLFICAQCNILVGGDTRRKAAYLIKSTGIASSVTANSELYWNLASRGSGKHLNTGMTKTHLKKTVIFRNPHHKIVDHYRVTLAIFGASCGAERRHYGHHQHSVFMDLFFGYVGK